MDKPDPASQYKHLVRHFFGRFFDLDALVSPQIDPIEKHALMFQILALLVLPGALKCMFLFPEYAYYIYRPVSERDLAVLTDICFLLSLSMTLLGLLTVFEWDMLFPNRNDYLVLTPMPVRTRTMFFAKFVALAAFLLVFTAAINICPTFLFPCVVLANNGVGHQMWGRTIPLSLSFQYMVSQALCILLGNIFVFLSAISLQGTLLMLIPPRLASAISRWMRFSCLVLLLCTLLTFWQISSVDQLIRNSNPLVDYYPPIWFIGMYEVLLGSTDPAMWRLARHAISALSLAGVLSVLSYAMCYRRFMRKSIESAGGAAHNSTGLRTAVNFILDRWLIKKAENRASFHFVGQTIFRSSRHALYIGTFLAVGVAMAAVKLPATVFSNDPSVFGRLESSILSIPLNLSFFLLVGMRVIFGVPVELEANWLFRLAPIRRIENSYAGVRRYLIGAIIMPVYLFAGLFYALFWNWSTILFHVCYGITVSWILMELLFCRFPKIPFTCSYLPGAAKIAVLWPIYVLGFGFFGLVAVNLEVWLQGGFLRVLYFFILAAVLLLVLIRRNIQPAGDAIRFEETSKEALILLDLKS